MTRIREDIAELMARTLPKDVCDIAALVEVPPDSALGDYAVPCFEFAKTLRKPPPAIAAEVAAAVRALLPPSLARVEQTGPYVNFFVNRAAMTARVLEDVFEQGCRYGSSDIGRGKTICMDFSHPNIAKPLGVHHLRSTVIGNSLHRILTALGYRVERINHLGDWGTQFGVIIAAYKKYADGDPLEGNAVEKLKDLYVRYMAEAQAEEKDVETDDVTGELMDEARGWFRRLEEGDREATRLYDWFKKISLAEFHSIYERLGVEFDSYAGEAFYKDRLDDTIARIEQAGIAELSEGALIVDLEPYDMAPCLLRKRDGATLYATRDIAAAIYRKETYGFHKNLYVVAQQQTLHFRQFFKVLELMGFDWHKDCLHLPFGMLSIEDAGTASTRRGRTVLLGDVLDTAVEKARGIVEESSARLDNSEKDTVARQVGIGAVVFSELSKRRVKDVTFRWEEALRFDGETGPYLQYTHARACSMLRKYGAEPDAAAVDAALLTLDEEFNIVRSLADFPRAIERAAAEYEPAIVSNALMDIASSFNRYYTLGTRNRDKRVLTDDAKLSAARAALVMAVRIVTAAGLDLIGIEAPEKM